MSSGLRRRTPADLEKAREAIPWVDDDDLEDIERRSPTAAGIMSMCLWGSGQFYAYDRWRAAGIFGGAVGAVVAIANLLPALANALVPVVALAASVGGAVDAARRARKVTRFAATRNRLALDGVGDPGHYRLLHAGAAGDPALAGALPALPAPAGAPAPSPSGAHAGLVDRLRKLHALRQGGVISDGELRERKVDLLEQAAPADRDALDELLFELLPLGNEGVLDPSDFDFIKQLVGGR